MKFIILLSTCFIVTVLSNAYACQVKVPTSEVQRYIEALPNGVPPLYSCQDKPEEDCFCSDEIIWEQAEIVTEFTQDDLGINIETKVLKNSEAKKAAITAKILGEKVAEEEKKERKKLANDKVKAFKFKGATIKELRDELNSFMIENAEVVE